MGWRSEDRAKLMLAAAGAWGPEYGCLCIGTCVCDDDAQAEADR